MDIATRMKERQTEARAKIRAAMWQSKVDADTVATIALQGGIEPAEVDKIEAEIQAAKVLLAEACAIDAAALKNEFDAAEKAAIEARKKADAAEAAAEKAACVADDAGRALSFARNKIQTCAQACRRGELPRELLPPAALAQVEFDDASAALQTLEAQNRDHAAAIRSAESLIEHVERKIERSKAAGEREKCEAGPGGIVTTADLLARRLKAEKTRLKNAKAGEKATAGAIDAARVEIEKLKTKIWKGGE